MPENVAPKLTESHLVEGEMLGRTLKEDLTPFSRNRRARKAPPERGLSTSSDSEHMLQRLRKVTAG